MFLQNIPPPTIAGFQQLLLTTVRSGVVELNDIAQIIHAGFHPGAPEEVVRASHMVLYRSAIQPEGLLNRFQKQLHAGFPQTMASLNAVKPSGLHYAIDGDVSEIRRNMREGRYGQMARTMMRASYAVWCALEQGQDRRAELEDLIGDYPTPLLRVPPMGTLSAVGLMHYWDRCEGLWALEDAESQNINRIVFGESMVQVFAAAEAKTPTQSTQIRMLAQEMRPAQKWQSRDLILRPEKHVSLPEAAKLLVTLLGLTAVSGTPVNLELVQTSASKLEDLLSKETPLSLRRTFLAEGGPLYHHAPPLSLALKAILESIDAGVASGALSVGEAAQLIEAVRQSASIYVDQLAEHRSVSRDLFVIRNPYQNQVNLSGKKDGPKGVS